MSNCHWCHGDCGGTCLGLAKSTQMTTSDPAYFLLSSGPTSTKEIHKDGCYICEDPEFAQMGLPLCTKCPKCGGHVAADDTSCDTAGCTFDAYEAWLESQPPAEKAAPSNRCPSCGVLGSCQVHDATGAMRYPGNVVAPDPWDDLL